MGGRDVFMDTADRCFSDAEYIAAGIPMAEDLSDCDVIMGVKEIPLDMLLENKTTFM